MAKENITGKWTEFKGEATQMWGKLTGDELERTKGNVKAIAGVLEQKYGELKDEAKAQFDQLVEKYHSKTDDAATAVADKSEEVKEEVQASKDESIRH